MTWRFADILTTGEAIDYGAGLMDRPGDPLATGLPAWDGACDETGGTGLADWWYVVLGGASNAGKTQLMLYLARRAAELELQPGVVTMEVPKRGLQRRVYANISAFGYYDFLHHEWLKGDPDAKVRLLASEIGKYRQVGAARRSLTVVERDSPPTLDDILEACDRLLESGCGAIFVDHLQLIKAPADQISDRATEISEALRWFAHSNKCLVIALSQLNRTASRERDRRPTMHDLWGGTAIESNSNQVILLDHSKQARDVVHPHLLRTWLYLDKNREGPNRVMIPVEANFKTGLWRQAMPDEVKSWPGE